MSKRLLIRIDSTPPGEAPIWVREKWVGLHLPLAQAACEPVLLYTGGVLSGPKTWLQVLIAWLRGRLTPTLGFVVGVVPALQVLEQASPEAAAWWRAHAPHLVVPKQKFLFHADVCSVVQINAPDAPDF
jgi:hypothetical protein